MGIPPKVSMEDYGTKRTPTDKLLTEVVKETKLEEK
jgi:hypothetical protein